MPERIKDMRNSVLCLVALLFVSIATPTANASESPGGVICWRGESGFAIGLPKGWRDEPGAAQHFDVCFMAIPDGINFNDSPVILYPQVFNHPATETPAHAADLAARVARKDMSRKPGGKNMTVRTGESFTTPQGLHVEIRSFDNGPPPDAFEAAAYLTYHTGTLGLVLSAKTREARDAFLPALLQVAREVFPLNVTDERKSAVRKPSPRRAAN
jgi:hypothetical protein